MRITIDIDASDLIEIQKSTGKKKKSPAVSQALLEYLQMQKRTRLVERALSGKTNFSLSNDEIEARDLYEAH